MSKKTKKKLWGGYNEYTYLDKDGKAVKFLARDDSDADLYRNKVGATAWVFLLKTKRSYYKWQWFVGRRITLPNELWHVIKDKYFKILNQKILGKMILL